jgi:hypothetical protein
LVSDWVVEHKPQKLSNNRYKCHTKKTLTCVFQEDPKFDLVGDTVQGKGDISQTKSGARMESLDGVRRLSLSNYSVVNLIHPMYVGVEMGMSKEKDVAMIFSKVGNIRCQQINKTVWDKARETLDLAQSVAYTNMRCKQWNGTHSTYV